MTIPVKLQEIKTFRSISVGELRQINLEVNSLSENHEYRL